MLVLVMGDFSTLLPPWGNIRCPGIRHRIVDLGLTNGVTADGALSGSEEGKRLDKKMI